jgi:outer membrane lipoprotein-sorting protein
LHFSFPQSPSINGAMPRVLQAATAVLAALLLCAAAPLTGADSTALDKVSDYLNSIHSMRGSFLQVDPSGASEQGDFYILKPGRMRFDYRPPNPTMVVSDGLTVAVFNKQLHTVDTYPLSVTPLNILLSNHVNLANDKNVTGVEHEPGSLIVRAHSSDTRASGDITIVFSDSPLELRQWTIVDAQGLATTVSLRNVQIGVALPPAIFSLSGPKKKD